MSGPLIYTHKIILFDLMDTLMFGGNRFAPTEDYAQTYRQIGGMVYSDTDAQYVIHQVHSHMKTDYGRPDCYDNFRHVRDYLSDWLQQLALPMTDIERLADTFAHHELGHIPDGHCAALRQLQKTHRLGVVSNLWSGKALFINAFGTAGILDLFDTLVFSSDHACIKPSPRLFREALDALGATTSDVLFVGDDWERDVLAAQAMGMTAVWVDKTGCGKPDNHWIQSVADLVR